MGSDSNSAGIQAWGLALLDDPATHVFVEPEKKIHNEDDVQSFRTSIAYRDIVTFILQLNLAMCPRQSPSGKSETWPLNPSTPLMEPVRMIQELLKTCDTFIDQFPPDTTPQRFGNISFRKWYEKLESQARGLLQEYLPESVLNCGTANDSNISVLDELLHYLLGSFGSPQRLDYGTGHELSFLAFVGCIWKLGAFKHESHDSQIISRNLVIGVFEFYFQVVRRLILTYTLEPAGSHGVWGLDDHFFLPYIFGSSQYSMPIANNSTMPVEGSHPDAPDTNDIPIRAVVNRERNHNMYFAAVGFIYDVKTGPFWEHSPMLFDISGVRGGWGKINKGMIKMYDAEVLSKFPVVQHFPFGSLFGWQQDTNNSNLSLNYQHSNK